MPGRGSWLWQWGRLVLAFARVRGGLEGGNFFVRLLTETSSALLLLLGGHASGTGGDGGGGAVQWHGGRGLRSTGLTTPYHHRSSADPQPWPRPSCSRWLYVFISSPSPAAVSNKARVRGQAGGLAGTSVDLLFFPIDTVKTRLQSVQGFAKAGGFGGIYKGVGSVIVGSAPGGLYSVPLPVCIKTGSLVFNYQLRYSS